MRYIFYTSGLVVMLFAVLVLAVSTTIFQQMTAALIFLPGMLLFSVGAILGAIRKRNR